MNRLKLNDWLVVAGGALVLVFSLVRWFSWELTNGGVVDFRDKSNAFDYFLTGFVPWLLLVGAAALSVLLATGQLVRGRLPWELILLAATGLGFVLILIRLIVGHNVDTTGDVDLDVSRGLGIWVSALGALVSLVGAFIGFRNLGVATEHRPVSGRPMPEREIAPPEPPAPTDPSDSPPV